MKICFIWAEKFRNFSNIGINLSSSLKFHYDNVQNVLESESCVSLPHNFFGEGISEVTGIIGKNGSGKSNALELICKVLKGGKTDVGGDFLVIVEDNNELVCFHHFKNSNPPKVNNKKDISFQEYPGKINPLKVVFFSNVFDDRRNGFNSDVADISVNNLYARKFYLTRKGKMSDFEKQINFINSKLFRTLDIQYPDKILVSLKLWTNRFNIAGQHYQYKENSKKVNEIRSFFRIRLKELIDHNKFIQAIKYGFFLDIYDKIIRDYGGKGEFLNDLIEDFQQFIERLSINKYTDEITDELIFFIEERIRYLENQSKFDLFGFYRDDEIVNSQNNKKPLIIEQLEFIKNIKNLFSNLIIKDTRETSRNRISENFIIDYSDRESIEIINEFMRLFESCNYVDVNWLGISSGQKAYLNLFSSIYDEIRLLRTQNLLLCIDEGDLYLHPKWQIEFFNKLVTILPKIYSGNIQLVLTSHSPFLLSDLPKQNITILDEKLPNSSIDGVFLKTNTFGGNLYDLYSGPFFLENKRTSDFAYNKIKVLIEKVEKKEYSIEDKVELFKLSNILGDEIIQFRINKLLKDD